MTRHGVGPGYGPSKLDLTNVIQIGLSQEIHILLYFLMEHITDIW